MNIRAISTRGQTISPQHLHSKVLSTTFGCSDAMLVTCTSFPEPIAVVSGDTSSPVLLTLPPQKRRANLSSNLGPDATFVYNGPFDGCYFFQEYQAKGGQPAGRYSNLYGALAEDQLDAVCRLAIHGQQ